MFRCIRANNPVPYLGILFDFIKQHQGSVVVTLKTDLLQEQYNSEPIPIKVAKNETFSCEVEEVYPTYVVLRKKSETLCNIGFYTIDLEAILEVRSLVFETHAEALLHAFDCTEPICKEICSPAYSRYNDLKELLEDPEAQEEQIQLISNGITTREYRVKNLTLLGNILLLEHFIAIPVRDIGGFIRLVS